MRRILLFLFSICLAMPTHAMDEPAMAMRLVAAGAPDLALQFARNALQGDKPDAAWRDVYWLAVGKSRATPDPRVSPPRAKAPAGAWSGYHLAFADRAAAKQDWTGARQHWMRAIWRDGTEPAVIKRAQAGIAQSWLAEGEIARVPEAVNPVFLRLLQGEPNREALAERAALSLIDARQPKQALDLLDAQAAQSSLRVIAQYRLASLLPEKAEADLRARGQEAMAWQGLFRLAEDRNASELRVEALEHLVELEPSRARHVFMLWQAYQTLAEQVANRHNWLVGTDAFWLAQARARLTKSPIEARALLAWLIGQGVDLRSRNQAVEIYAEGFAQQAPRILGSAPVGQPRMHEALRYRLGKQALALGDPALAAGWWEGVAAAATALPPRTWYLKQAEANLKARRTSSALEWLNHLLALHESLSPEETAAVIGCANDLLRQGLIDGAERIAEQVFVYASPGNLRDVWQLRGAVAELRGRWAEAAANYLLAAGEATDNQAQYARARAARDLERAGLTGDVLRQGSLIDSARGVGSGAAP